MRYILVAFLGILSASAAWAGGIIGGGGTGIIALELENASISRDQFTALVQSGADESPVVINKKPAKVRTVNFQSKTVELEIQGLEEPVVLKTQELNQ